MGGVAFCVIENTAYCDVSGEEIEDHFEMLSVKVVNESKYLASQKRDQIKTLHISGDEHPIEYDRNENQFTAYVGDTDSVVMIKEDRHMGVKRYGLDTEQKEIIELMDIINDCIDDD